MKHKDPKLIEFVAKVVCLLHHNLDEFLLNLSKNEQYEFMLYQWITNLFHKEKSVDETIKIILEKRRMKLDPLEAI